MARILIKFRSKSKVGEGIDQYTNNSVYNIEFLYTKIEIMRTNIIIDDNLMADALKAAGVKTKKEAVELGLKTLITLHKQKLIKELKGKLLWEGNLDEMRTDK